MKKLFAIVLCLVMVLSLVACGEEAAPETTTEPTTTTEEPTTTTEATEEITEEITEEVTEEFTEEVTEIVTEEIDLTSTEAVDVLKALVYAYNTTHAGTDYQLPVAGGGYENSNWESPDVVALTEVDYLTYTLLVPETEQANLTAVASAMHVMRLNNFCFGAYNLVEGADKAAFATAMRDAFKNHQWTSGPADQLLIAEVNGCVVAGYGLTDVLNYFAAEITATYPEATVLFNEPIAG